MNQTSSREDFLKNQLSAHRLIVSPVGILKICTIILYLVGPILSLSVGVCSDYRTWLQLLAPIATVVSGVVIAGLYISLALGLAKKIPNIWVKVDITCSISLAVLTLVLSILVISNCSNSGGITVVPGILGIIGSLLLFISAATLFVTWLNSEEDEPAPTVPDRNALDLKRKSYMI